MPQKIAALSFEGAIVDIYFWDDYPDGMPDEESNFHNGYLELYVFGTGELPLLKDNYWRMVYVWPRYDMIVPEVSTQALVPVDESCSFDDVDINIVTLRTGPEAPRHPIVIVDFKLPDGDIIKKIVLLQRDGTSIEIPEETLQ